jgi:hypothetical protein
MRFTLPCLAGVLVLLAAPVARAQTITITQVTRENSPRSSEVAGGVVPIEQGVGLRDCNCENWRFQGTFTSPGTVANIEWWVGKSVDACRTSSRRAPSASTPECWQIPSSVVAPIRASGNVFNVVIPARWLVDPINGRCQPPGGLSSTGQLYFTVLMRPPEDMSPAASQVINYNFTPLESPTNVMARAGENSARVSWSFAGSGDDAGTGSVVTNLAGFYVLCLPRHPRFDAGTPIVCGDAGRFDFDAMADAGSDAGTDATVDASTTDAGGATDAGTIDDAGAACGVGGLPTDFDPNNDEQFNQFRCTDLLGVSASQVDINDLDNGSQYRFAVVAQDTSGNRSEPSAPSNCASPNLVTDFWEHYENRGGTARPGFCAVHPGFAGTGALAGIALGGVALVLLQRRRKRTRRDAHGVDA